MKKETELKLMFYFTVSYLILFAILGLIKGNYEFLYYTFIMTLLISIILTYHKKFNFSSQILLGLTVLGAMHIFGGNIYINGTRLYDTYWFFNFLRYDHLVHSFGTFIATFVIYNLLNLHINPEIKANKFLISIIMISIAMGIGAYNEILELGAVLFLNAGKQVGNYLNNAFDLVFNLIGSIIASLIIIRKKRN